jgi:hypothetical protein
MPPRERGRRVTFLSTSSEASQYPPKNGRYAIPLLLILNRGAQRRLLDARSDGDGSSDDNVHE